MSAFVGLGGRRGDFAAVIPQGRRGFQGGLGSEPAAPAPAAAPVTTLVDNRPPEPAESPAAPEPTAAEQQFAENEALRAREHEMLLAELEAERKRLRESTARIGQLCGELVRLRGQALQQLREGAGPLMVEGARALATEGLRAQPELLARMVDEACDAVGRVGAVVRVHPADVEQLQPLLAPGIEVIADPTVLAGCICEGPTGRVDRRVEAGAEALAAETAVWKASG